MNLDEIDREVRESLLAHADDAPSGAGTLDAVRSRSRRNLVRQRAGLAGVAALVAVAAAVGVPYALTGTKHTPAGPRVGVGGPAPTQTTTTAPPATTTTSPATTPTGGPTRSRVQLVAGQFNPVRFPLTPTFTPPGLGTATEGRTVGEVRLIYAKPGNDSPFLIATVDDTSTLPIFSFGTPKSITVNGHPAKLYTGGTFEGNPAVAVTWKLHGKAVAVQASNVSEADVVRYANGLAEHAGPAHPLPFTMALTPKGYLVSFQEIHTEYTPTTGFIFDMSSPGQVDNQTTNDGLGVSSDFEGDPTGTPITVGGHPGKINITDEAVDIYIIRPGFVCVVHEPVHGPLSVADLIRFAGGVAPAS